MVRVGVVFRDAPQALLLVPEDGPARAALKKAGDPRGILERGRKVMGTSPSEPGPGDAPAGVPVHSPVPRPGDRRHDIEPVRPPVVAQPVTPRPSVVLHLDPDAVLAEFSRL